VDAPTDGEVSAPADAVAAADGSHTAYGRVRVSHIGLNDNVVEGLECVDIPAFSVQYHPEAAAGPHDSEYLFDRFLELMATATSAVTSPTSEGRL
jgi:carbamoyl-phosphate synthase small subunit